MRSIFCNFPFQTNLNFMKNILVAVDRLKDAEKLIDQAVGIAKLTDAKIWLVHVSEAEPEDYRIREAGPQFKYDKLAKDKKEISDSMERWTQEVKEKHNVKIEGQIIEGTVTKSLIKLVDGCNIDLVVAGHRKKNLVYGLFTSNNKKDLIDELNIPLLAVPLG